MKRGTPLKVVVVVVVVLLTLVLAPLVAEGAVAQTLSAKAHEDLAEIELIGQLFAASKISEITMPTSVRKVLGVNQAEIDRPRFVASRRALDLFRLRLDKAQRISLAKGRKTTELSATETAEARYRLDAHGFVALPELVDAATSRNLSTSVLDALWNPDEEFSSIAARKYRKDLPLRIEGAPGRALRELLHFLWPMLEAQLGSNCTLVEFSTMTSFPGAGEQDFHPDARMGTPAEIETRARIYSIFVYLDTVSEDSAALDVMPGTHTHFHFVDEDEFSMMSGVPFLRLAVPQGSVVIFDSRTHHRGSANTSPRTRPTLYFSVMEDGKLPPEGPTFTLHRSVAADGSSLRVRDLVVSREEGGLVGNLAADVANVADAGGIDSEAPCLKAIRRSGCADLEDVEAKFRCVVFAALKAQLPPTEADAVFRAFLQHELEAIQSAVADAGPGVGPRRYDHRDDEGATAEEDRSSNSNYAEEEAAAAVEALVAAEVARGEIPMPRCALLSRVERLCGAGVYGRSVHLSWAALDPGAPDFGAPWHARIPA
ncbi:Hypothetical Protein FCC1311_053582 [Hondaea fermentalgiana]|uniref:Uncharacterized protein n=1 Tax=Hondaea fermentalgiana TaxID=2315210 RepID=A0A2R5GEX2_9STRA|nr:Hypothetical Protein FCC1311_053582 [Hondaea fermentalgiana]|eukprot:GBG29135.1 Hypothetical Protein FCC1311_053582 [Hondaea fermentalgiana]